MATAFAALWPAAGGAVLALAGASLLFVGVERRIGEHDDDYSPFLKQQPTLTTIYLNPADCGMCEIPAFEDFPAERLAAFAAFCAVRFGIAETRVCHAIVRERQLMESAGGTLP